MKKLFIIALIFCSIMAYGQANDTICIKCLSIDPHHTTAIGYHSEAKTSTQYDSQNVIGGQMAVGAFARALSWRAEAFGDYALAGSTSSTAIGYGAVAIMVHGIAIGRGSYLPNITSSIYNNLVTLSTPVVMGNNTTDFGIGNWWGHKFRIPPSGIGVGNVIPSQITRYYHGQDAYDDTTNEVNIDGGHIGIAAGRGTGTGKSGEIRFYTAPVKNLGGNTKNPLVLSVKITANGAVPFKVTDAQMKALKDVEEGTEIYNTTLHCPCYFNATAWQCASSQFQ